MKMNLLKSSSLVMAMIIAVMLLLTGCSVSQSDNEKADNKFSAMTVKKSFVIPNPIPGWKVVGRHDHDHDNIADLFWYRENNTGEVRIWLLNSNGGVKPNGDIEMPCPAWPPSGWKVVGVGDYNYDGNTDLLWRRANDTGEVRVWLLGGINKDAKLSEVITGEYVYPGSYYIRCRWQPQWHPKYVRKDYDNLIGGRRLYNDIICEGFDGSNTEMWKWKMTMDGEGRYRFENMYSGEYLMDRGDLPEFHLPKDGFFGKYGYGNAGLHYYNGAGYPNTWNITLNNEGYAIIKNAVSGKYMNIEYQAVNIRDYFYLYLYENADPGWYSAQWIIEPADYELTRVYSEIM